MPAFLGESQQINDSTYVLEPTILSKSDFVSQNVKFGSKSQMNRLFNDLPEDFQTTAKSELYRKSGGWVDRGVKEKKIKQFNLEDNCMLVPILSNKAVGIDTSSNNDDTYVCIAFFDNYKAGYHYLEKMLQIPKSRTPHVEFKSYKLDSKYKDILDKQLENLLKISCSAILMIKTNALRHMNEKMIDVFIKLIKGCFTDYDHLHQTRKSLQEELFALANKTPIHCDEDFSPQLPYKIVRQLVQNLSDGKPFESLHVEKESHESEPIQLTDIICGILKQHIINKDRRFLVPWEFDNTFKCKPNAKFAKAFIWKFDSVKTSSLDSSPCDQTFHNTK